MLRTEPTYAAAIRAAADVEGQSLDLSEPDVVVLAAIAYDQPITRDGVAAILRKVPARKTIARLRGQQLIGARPRSPTRIAPQTFVTTARLLKLFGME